MITALVLAAGLSSRMGTSKPLLPWGARTLLEHILASVQASPVEAVLVVTGHQHAAIAQRLAGGPARVVFNPDYASGEMLASLQAGLRAAPPQSEAALLVLGDQPALDPAVIQQLVAAYRAGAGRVIIPSYQMRRGHPLLIDRRCWAAILALRAGQSLRDFMHGAREVIHHVSVAQPGILQDLDTPEEYRRALADFQRAQGLAVPLFQEV